MRVTESMGPAWETMKRVLFRPFNIGTWFSFGFIFFLQSCMEGGGGNFRIPSGSNSGSSGHDGSDSGDTGNNLAGIAHDLWSSLPFSQQLAGSGLDSGMLVVIAVVALVVAIPMVILMYWLGTRGQMMSIRAVASGQATIGEQWNATREAGGMLFKFHLAMLGIGLIVFVPLMGGGALLALPAIRDGAPFESVLPALIGIGVLALVLMLPLFIVGAMARNFVAPIMLKQGVGAREGWKRFWAVGRNHVGGIVLFYVMRILVGIAASIVGVVAGLLTCCLGFLPVLQQTLMAPYNVFERAWTLEVLASMSPDFDLRGGGAPPPHDPFAGGGGYGGGGGGFNPYTPPPTGNPYAPPGYGGGGGGNPYGGGGGNPYGGDGGGGGGGGYGGPPPGGFGNPT
jgi:hypothetical protein